MVNLVYGDRLPFISLNKWVSKTYILLSTGFRFKAAWFWIWITVNGFLFSCWYCSYVLFVGWDSFQNSTECPNLLHSHEKSQLKKFEFSFFGNWNKYSMHFELLKTSRCSLLTAGTLLKVSSTVWLPKKKSTKFEKRKKPLKIGVHTLLLSSWMH